MNDIKIFQNAQDSSVSVVNSYYEDHLMHIFLDKFQQGGKYFAQRASHQAKLRREEIFNDQKSLFITSLQTDYLNINRSSGLVEVIGEQIMFRKNVLFVEVLNILQICF